MFWRHSGTLAQPRIGFNAAVEGSSISDVWTRFGNLSDSVIRLVEIRPEARPWSAVVELDAQEPPSSDGPWHRIRFDFIDAREWRFEQTRADMLVVFEARAERVDDLVCVTFDAATMPASSPTLDDFRRTDAYVAAADLEVSVRLLLA
jgi:hypothetical protein